MTTIRRLGPDDRAIFRDIRLAMLTTDPKAFGSTHDEWAAKSDMQVADWLTSMRSFAALDETGRALSTASWHRQPGRIARHRGHVIAAYSRPEARGRGLFARVMAAIEADAAGLGVTQLELDVAVGNEAAHRSYLALEYAEIGRIPDALCHDGVYADQIMMLKKLDRA